MSDGSLRVLELAGDFATRLAGVLLGDLGAHVVRVDDGPAGAHGDAILDRGKSRVAPDACAEVAADVDLVLLGTASEAVRYAQDAVLAALRPEATVVKITGGEAAGEAVVVSMLEEARSGLMWQHRDDEARPYCIGEPVAAVGTALLACIGGLCSVLRVARGDAPEPRPIAVSHLDGALAAQCMSAAFLEGGAEPDDGDRYRDGLSVGLSPAVRYHEAADGWLLVGAVTRAQWRALLTLVGRPDLIDEPELAAGPLGYVPHEAGVRVTEAVAAFVRPLSVAAAVDMLQSAGVVSQPALVEHDFMRHPQAIANGLIVDLDGDPVPGEPPARGIGNVLPLRPLGPSAADGAAPAGLGPAWAGAAPLAGVRVLELASFIAAPMVSRILADLGADVLKVETPTGDELRPVGLAFSVSNRGKRSVALDLEHERGRATLARLIEAADVLVTNQRPDRERQLGTDAASIAPRAPLLVKLSMSAYGADGPLRNLPAIDASVQALSGLAMARGGGVRPAGFIGAMLDSTSGYLGALGVLAALVRRTRERRGLLVSTSLLNMAALFQVTSLVEPSRLARPRLDEGRNGYGACQRLYRTADGWVCLAARTEADARRLLDALQVGADDVQGALLAAPVDGVLAGRIAAAIRGMPSAALLEACAGAGFEACAEVRRLSSWATSTPPFVAVEQPPFGTLRQVGPLVGAASARTETLRGAPAAISLGGVEALREWGIGEEQLGRLVDEHVVVAEPVEVPARAVNL